MRLEKYVLVTIVACALVVLAVPFYRHITLAMAVSPRKGGYLDSYNISVKLPGSKTDEQLLNERPNDFLLRLGLAQENLHPSIYTPEEKTKQTQRLISDLLRDYPKNGEVYAVAFEQDKYSDIRPPDRMENWAITPQEAIATRMKLEKPTKERLAGCRRNIVFLDKAILADPENGWFRCLKASYLFGLRQDSEALRELHRAATASQFSDYGHLRVNSIDHLFNLRGNFDPVRRTSVKAGLFSSTHGVSLRGAARIAAHLAYKDIRGGAIDKGVRAALDVVNCGHNMARYSSFLMPALMGSAITAVGANALDPQTRLGKISIEERRAKRIVSYTRFLRSHGYAREAAVLQSQWRQMDKMNTTAKAYINEVGDTDYYLTLQFAAFFVTAVISFFAFLLCLAFWMGLSLLTIKSAPTACWDRRATVISFLLSLLVLVPSITYLLSPVSMQRMTRALELITNPSAESPYHSVHLAIPLGIGLLALLAGAAVTLKRKREEGVLVMPATALIIAYIAAIGALVYTTLGLIYFTETSAFFRGLQSNWGRLLVCAPMEAILAYAVIRAVQVARKGRKEMWRVMAATIKYSSAIGAGVFAAAFLILLIATASYGLKVDSIAGTFVDKEAATIQSAFK